ncbi:hypothetical protein CEH05_15010 [Halobacillus halophilus]|nr:hypothetical protein CEH05_15010 [Halobacillus halophilus]
MAPFSYSRVRSSAIVQAAKETTRLPREKGLGEIPQGVKRARKLTVPPVGKRVVSVAALILFWQRSQVISKLSLQVSGAYL